MVRYKPEEGCVCYNGGKDCILYSHSTPSSRFLQGISKFKENNEVVYRILKSKESQLLNKLLNVMI